MTLLQILQIAMAAEEATIPLIVHSSKGNTIAAVIIAGEEAVATALQQLQAPPMAAQNQISGSSLIQGAATPLVANKTTQIGVPS